MSKTFKQTCIGAIGAMFGWRVIAREGIPDKCIVLGVPHTSNWDFIVLLFGAGVYGKKLHWLGKAELFKFGMGPLMRALGGFPVYRHAAHGMVQQVADTFARVDEMRLVIPPEGTRKHTQYWKSGFYHMALAAKVPLHLAKVNYIQKTIDFGESVVLTGDVQADMDRIRAWYATGAAGRFPENAGPIRLRDEENAVSIPDEKR